MYRGSDEPRGLHRRELLPQQDVLSNSSPLARALSSAPRRVPRDKSAAARATSSLPIRVERMRQQQRVRSLRHRYVVNDAACRVLRQQQQRQQSSRELRTRYSNAVLCSVNKDV